ncbi:putative UDP-glucuronosyl/UDP-glucosyltransferase [Helianthus annuus]|uniref:UDP-glucuronosyl/UDP-glucosyltransferase n=2 Tax=Helianthus annuus TaxID=4232 RepID=A0A9K3ECH5_HELAN|nr:putative UDP-glucuronosyl/UDP-glucosyltransferase [Helianthus annuus]KAJ0465828.1 putative UDP-glucuronosyl/UDP-glucosyltransferase [Helianthus annuus]KAJ0470740.1 putative UDP-glucuronosyl/UDP-glucosyltransferase [Helianthus annuus]KAJ0487418.1 putative UDP-glucuronosyl/UDP-glucosyltransferase [Helianthus annuus]KAJ0657861.1 putative UDP-glucuronosyl/UDP-glucosyltransferase [Helianthus annuus]
METTVGRQRRVIMFPLPYQGHVNPMFQLANLLYSKGFSITIFHTNFNKPKTSNYPHFTFRFILDNDPHDERYANLPLQGMGAFSRIFLFNKCGADQLRHQLELELSAKDEPPVSCLITDASWHFTQSVADSLNLPRLVLRTSSLFCFLIYASIPLLDDLGYFNLSDNTATPLLDGLGYNNVPDDERLEEQVAEFPVLKVKDVIKIGFKKDNDGMGDIISNMVKQTKASSGIIWNSFKELEQLQLETIRRDIPAPCFLIPFAKHFTTASSSLLDQDRSFFPWRNILWKWAPQQEVLGHEAIGAFWTHSGWNSTVESVCEGVPMICSPFWGDQPLDARYVSDVWKVGVYLENGWKREEITNAIRRVMADEEMRETSRGLKQKLDASLIEGGSSYESVESLVDYISSF